jgi:hypothetical protein
MSDVVDSLSGALLNTYGYLATDPNGKARNVQFLIACPSPKLWRLELLVAEGDAGRILSGLAQCGASQAGPSGWPETSRAERSGDVVLRQRWASIGPRWSALRGSASLTDVADGVDSIIQHDSPPPMSELCHQC